MDTKPYNPEHPGKCLDLHAPPPDNNPEPPQGSDGEARVGSHKEVAYDLARRLRQELAVPAVLSFYISNLAFYAKNSTDVNTAIHHLLWTVASPQELNLEPMLYQVAGADCRG